MAVDKAQIRKFIDQTLEEAKEWCAKHPEKCGDLDLSSGGMMGHNALMWAVVCILIVYIALFYGQPKFVMVEKDSVMVFDMSRAWMMAIVAGILVYVMM